MQVIRCSSKSNGDGEVQGEDGDFLRAYGGENNFRELAQKANSVSLSKIFRFYKINIDEFNRKIVCPFHKNGKEASASFYYYPETNSWHCYGCKEGSRVIDFVSLIEKCSYIDAINKVLSIFENENEVENSFDDSILNRKFFSERLEIMLSFSDLVREFRLENDNEKAFNFIESICHIFDNLETKNKLNNEALKSVISKLKERIDNYA
jgi:hypothetical protein